MLKDMKIGILNTSMFRLGGDISHAYEFAKCLNARIFTNIYNPELEAFYPELENLAVPPKKNVREVKGFDQFQHMVKMTARRDLDCDFVIYMGDLPAYHQITHNIPYIYHCFTPPRAIFVGWERYLEGISDEGRFPKHFAKYKGSFRKVTDVTMVKGFLNPDQVTVNSEQVCRRFIKFYNRTPRAILYPPTNTKRYKWKPPEDFFLTVNRLESFKRVDMQIRAFAKTDKRLVVVGDGPERENLEALAKKVGGTIDILGKVPDEELLDLYSRCSAFVFSSSNEDFGLGPIEAFSSGKPTISIAEGGPLEYCTKDNSFLFKDEKELVSILERFDDADGLRMKKACLKTAKRFDTETIIEELKGHIEDIYNHYYH